MYDSVLSDTFALYLSIINVTIKVIYYPFLWPTDVSLFRAAFVAIPNLKLNVIVYYIYSYLIFYYNLLFTSLNSQSI